MTILILVNGAPGYKSFFSALGRALEENGYAVRYAVDARRSAVMEPDEYVDRQSDYFSDFFRKGYSRFLEEANRLSTETRQASDTWRDWFYADFDRFSWYRVNLNKDTQYWMSAYVALRQFFEEQFNKYMIVAVLYENVSNSFAYVAYSTARERGIPYLGIVSSRLPGRFEIQTSIRDEADKVAKLYLVADKESPDETAWLNDYLARMFEVQPDYMRYNELNMIGITRKYVNMVKMRKALRIIEAQVRCRGEHQWSYQYGSPVALSLAMLRRSFARRFREPLIRKYFSSPCNQDQYYVYPIHYHPESSTSVLAPSYTDELTNITNIAFLLPVGAYLYVKDHVSAYALQSVSFYRRVAEIPNVKLINPNCNIKQLIAGSRGVITITGTAGFEALLIGKPVYCFGDVFYSKLPGVRKVTSFEELAEVLHHAPDLEYSEQVARRILLAYYRYTWPGSVNLMKKPSHMELGYVVDAIIAVLNSVETSKTPVHGTHDYGI